jgi:hypothetical protein
VIVSLAAEDDRGGVVMAIDEAGQHRLAGSVDDAARMPGAIRSTRAGMDDAIPGDRDLSVRDHGHALRDRIEEIGADQQVDLLHSGLRQHVEQAAILHG